MGLPLPKVVADVGPGGPLVTAMGGMNSLANDNILRQINSIKKDYLPDTLKAANMSKLAYANLMGPQFMAKLLANNGAVANMGDAQAKEALQSTVDAARGTRTGNAMNQMPSYSGVGQPSSNSFSGWVQNATKNLFGQKPPQGNNAINQRPNAYDNSNNSGVSAEGPGPINNGSPFVGREGYKPPASQGEDGIDHEYDAFINNWLKTPEGQKELAKGERANIPSPEDYRRAKQARPSIEMDLRGGQQPEREKTYGEKTAEYNGILEEGKEAGKIRATGRKELDQEYQQALQLKQPFEKLNSVISNPVFQKLRQIPGFQQLQMNAKANIGNKEEQKLIGEFQAASKNVVAATVKGFGGRILASEIPLSESMKLSDKDTIGVMLGKAPVVEAFNEFTLQRSRLASKLMKDYHMDKGEALEKADKMVDGDAIRKQIDMQLNPITDEDIDVTAKETGMTRDQVIKRLRTEGRYNG